MRKISAVCWLNLLLAPFAWSQAESPQPFVISVVDSESKRPVPLVEFRSTHNVRYVTDNSGIIVIDDPELNGKKVYFHISSHGYEVSKDGLGFRGTRFQIEPGQSAKFEIQRVNRAERMYRTTGFGRYHHSVRAGLREQDPLDSSGVSGCDSVLTVPFGDRMFWVWGDTNRISYPLGNFHATGATTPLNLDLEQMPEFQFFQDGEGFVKPIAKLPGEGPTWLTGLVAIPDASGTEHLVATYQKIRGALTLYETGLCEWDPSLKAFQKVRKLDLESEPPFGHPFRYTDAEGAAWLLYADPLPRLRIPWSYEAWLDPTQHEPVQSDADFVDLDSGESVQPHRGTIAWNEFRKRWVMIFTQQALDIVRLNERRDQTDPLQRESEDLRSQLGEVYFAESDSPFGPWRDCLKVATHQRYSFYNPKQHPEFQIDDGRVIYFEGTYTQTFSRALVPTPRYDYNQVMYRLDLSRIPVAED